MATAAATSQFAGVDFLDLDTLLSEEERAVRDTVRTWVDENLMPVIGEAYIEGEFPKQLIPGMAELGLFGANLPEEYGCAGLNNVAYGLIMQELERGDSGDPLLRLGAGRAGDVPDLRLRLRGAEEALAAAAGGGAGDRLLRPDRARLRLQPRRHDHHRARDEGRLGAQRHQDVDHQRLAGHGRDRLGQDRRHRGPQVDPRLHRPDRHQGLHGARTRRGSSRCARRDTSEIHLQDVPAAEGRDPAQVAAGSRARSCASPRRATASRGARSARRWRASTRRSRYARTPGDVRQARSRRPRSSRCGWRTC